MAKQSTKLEIQLEKLLKKLNKETEPLPERVTREAPVSTIPIPESPSSVVVNTSKYKPSLKVPESPAAAPPPKPEQRSPHGMGGKQESDDEDKEPLPNYSKMTIGEILQAVKKLDDKGRERVLRYEQKHGKRKQIIDPLVNWNS